MNISLKNIFPSLKQKIKMENINKLNMEETLQQHPYDSAGFFSRIFFWWFNQFAVIGLKKKFEESDLCKHLKEDDSDYLGNILQKEWNVELRKKNPSLLKSIIRVFGSKCVLIYIMNMFQECCIFIFQAYLIGIVIDYFEYKFKEKKLVAYLSAVGICICLLLHIIIFHTYLFNAYRLSIKIASAVSNVIYKKGLKLNHASLGKSHIGQMVNLLSNDIGKFRQFVSFAVYLISGPGQIIIMIIMFWQYLGPAALAGISIVMLYVPLQIGLGKVLSLLRFKTAKLSDKRLHLVNELLAGMRIIKMYAWEILFAESVEKTRRKEIENVRKSLFIYGIPYSMAIIMTKIMLFFSFFAYFMTQEKLTATVAFVTSSLLANTYRTVFFLFPQAVLVTAEVLVSVKRIQKFLLLEEIQPTIDVQDSRPCLKDCGVWVNSVIAYWSEDIKPTLQGITFDAQPGELVVIVGSVGSGKTSLLMALLGEIPISSGKIRLRGKVSYSSQEAWIYNGTIRENILFSNDYNEKKYKEILYVSALEKDIDDFPERDLTVVGERGRIMSGGQKARINLARALYHDADIFLLDDPFSAVDAPVAKHIFENCIQKYLKEKVTILATHQIQLLKAATKIILLKEGRIQAVGDYDEMKRSGINLDLFPQRVKTDTENSSDYISPSFYDKSVFGSANTSQDVQPVKDVCTEHNKTEVKLYESANLHNYGKMNFRRAIAYSSYINTGVAKIFQLFLLILFLLTQLLLNSSDYWIVKWTNRNFNSVARENKFDNCTMKADRNISVSNCTENEVLPIINDETNMYVYSGLILGLTISSLIATVSYFILCSKCSINLHRKFLHCIIRVPISFLDMNPVGKLLSRFSRDMAIVDQQLPVSTLFVINACMNILGMIILQIAVQPYLIIPSFILLLTITIISYFFVGVTSDLLRMEGTTSSPIFSHLSTTLYGISTIRAFKTERSFEYAFNKCQNKNTSCKFLSVCSLQWNATKIHISCFLNIVITLVTVFNVSSPITGAEVGLILSFSLTITITLIYIFIHIVQADGHLTSVERILDYSKLRSEASLSSSPDKQPPDDWPQKGMIEFRDVSLQYEGDKQHVLKKLNFHIKPGEKIGIVGRTGAGKSSIIAALFRTVETTGVISVDGVVTKDIGLHDLRSKMSIIPQDPLLFSGSLRKNIDPFDKHIDDTLWKVIEEVQLKNAVQNLKEGLDAELSEGGSNFSVGQRQLICLARAILHRNKILILDEATAFIDKETDSLIQKIIREKFSSSTILTIAHRLQTVMDSDRIMVLQDGNIEEFDKPYILLQNSKGIFYNMAKITGKEIPEHHIITNKQRTEMKDKIQYPKQKENFTELNFSSRDFKVNDEEIIQDKRFYEAADFQNNLNEFCEDTKM